MMVEEPRLYIVSMVSVVYNYVESVKDIIPKNFRLYSILELKNKCHHDHATTTEFGLCFFWLSFVIFLQRIHRNYPILTTISRHHIHII